MREAARTIRRATTERTAQDLAGGTPREGACMIEISDEYMIATIDVQIVATVQ